MSIKQIKEKTVYLESQKFVFLFLRLTDGMSLLSEKCKDQSAFVRNLFLFWVSFKFRANVKQKMAAEKTFLKRVQYGFESVAQMFDNF